MLGNTMGPTHLAILLVLTLLLGVVACLDVQTSGARRRERLARRSLTVLFDEIYSVQTRIDELGNPGKERAGLIDVLKVIRPLMATDFQSLLSRCRAAGFYDEYFVLRQLEGALRRATRHLRHQDSSQSLTSSHVLVTHGNETLSLDGWCGLRSHMVEGSHNELMATIRGKAQDTAAKLLDEFDVVLTDAVQQLGVTGR